jgi:hypothetical protein
MEGLLMKRVIFGGLLALAYVGALIAIAYIAWHP